MSIRGVHAFFFRPCPWIQLRYQESVLRMSEDFLKRPFQEGLGEVCGLVGTGWNKRGVDDIDCCAVQRIAGVVDKDFLYW